MRIKIHTLADFEGAPDSVVCADCIDAMRKIPRGSVDMVLTDLPYGTTAAKWDIIIPFEKMWRRFDRVCAPNAAIVLFAAQPFTSQLVMSKPEWFKYEYIWVKNFGTGHLNAKKMPMMSHENILVFYQAPPVYNPQMREGHMPMPKGSNSPIKSKIYGKYSQCYSRTGATDRYPKSVLEFSRTPQPLRRHSSQKPVGLLATLIKTYTDAGAVVLDATAGSLLTVKACKETGRRFIAIEKDEACIRAAVGELNGRLL